MTEQGIDVALPQTSPHKIEQSQEPVTVTIAKNGDIYLGSSLVTVPKLIDNLKAKAKQKKDLGVIIKADKNVNYGSVIQVLDELNNAGITQVGMATEAKL
jgi:biopolymer transport protein TolR